MLIKFCSVIMCLISPVISLWHIFLGLFFVTLRICWCPFTYRCITMMYQMTKADLTGGTYYLLLSLLKLKMEVFFCLLHVHACKTCITFQGIFSLRLKIIDKCPIIRHRVFLVLYSTRPWQTFLISVFSTAW